jgi:protein-L-isoaspartate(D-aspartate) O-methyltransferase
MNATCRAAALAALLAGSLLSAPGASCDGSPAGAPRSGSPRSAAPLEPAPPGTELTEEWFLARRGRLIEELAASGEITDGRVLDVLRRVPRHEFVPPAYRHLAYRDSALPIDENQTISQPYIVALMTQLLDLDGSEKVLEVGTGSGYQAAILGELVREGEVYTVEILPKLHEKATRILQDLKERGVLSFKKLETVLGDGSKGHPAAAPYDAILVTAAPRKVPVALLNQLRPGGRLVIPVGDLYQELQLIERREDGTYQESTIAIVRFVPLVGED